MLITDDQVSRGWEASHILVVDFNGFDDALANLVMRTVGHCALVQQAPLYDSESDSSIE